MGRARPLRGGLLSRLLAAWIMTFMGEPWAHLVENNSRKMEEGTGQAGTGPKC
jgi:hypothetical protein